MSDWVKFLRDEGTKKAFKQILEDERKEKQQIERKQRIGGRVKALRKSP